MELKKYYYQTKRVQKEQFLSEKNTTFFLEFDDHKF